MNVSDSREAIFGTFGNRRGDGDDEERQADVEYQRQRRGERRARDLLLLREHSSGIDSSGTRSSIKTAAVRDWRSSA